jgi:hypothetical protein
VRNDAVNTTIAGVPALAFHDFDAAMGQTYEVWFIRGGFLYEISTYKELEPWLNQILATGASPNKCGVTSSVAYIPIWPSDNYSNLASDMSPKTAVKSKGTSVPPTATFP